MMGMGDTVDKEVIDIKQELCYETCNNSKTAIPPEAMYATISNTEHLRLHDGSNFKTNINQSEDQPQNLMDEVHIKHEINSDSDIEVGLAYRIVDTFNFCEGKSFKREGELISTDTETPFKIGLQNDHNQTQLRFEVDNKTDIVDDLDYKENNNLNAIASDKGKITITNENEDYMNIEHDVNKMPVHNLQSKGM